MVSSIFPGDFQVIYPSNYEENRAKTLGNSIKICFKSLIINSLRTGKIKVTF